MDICSHCRISIDPRFDEAHTVLIDGEPEIICDSCDNDFRVFGSDFGDSFYKQQLGWQDCCHKQWAAEETAIREATA